MHQKKLFDIEDTDTSAGTDTKKCRICEETKSVEDFYLDRGAVYSKCKKCCKEYNEGLKKAKETAPTKPENNLCECCGTVVEKWYCDHYPNSNRFRGWVCFKCNNAAGSVGDSYEGAVKLFNYLYKRKNNDNS